MGVDQEPGYPTQDTHYQKKLGVKSRIFKLHKGTGTLHPGYLFFEDN